MAVKKVKKKNPTQKKPAEAPKSKFLVFLLILFFVLLSDLLWTYLVPFCLNSKYPVDVINKALSEKIGFNVKASNATFYTTQSFAVGLNLSNVELAYPQNLTSQKYNFLKTRFATVEIPLIPYLLKTIKFNKFDLRLVEIELYQDEDGNYVYINQIKKGFNPNMKDYLLEVPSINLIRYQLNNFNAKTQEYKVDKGKKKTISPSVSKLVLKDSENKTINIK